jgi:hypothetical protein
VTHLVSWFGDGHDVLRIIAVKLMAILRLFSDYGFTPIDERGEQY